MPFIQAFFPIDSFIFFIVVLPVANEHGFNRKVSNLSRTKQLKSSSKFVYFDYPIIYLVNRNVDDDDAPMHQYSSLPGGLDDRASSPPPRRRSHRPGLDRLAGRPAIRQSIARNRFKTTSLSKKYTSLPSAQWGGCN